MPKAVPVFRESEFVPIAAIPFKMGNIEDHWRDMWFGELIFGVPRTEVITLPQIQAVVAKHFRVNIDVMLSPTRSYLLTLPRQIAIYFARKYTTYSTTQLGQRFDRDHSTILYSCRKIESLINRSDPVVHDINAITRAIGR